jgi:hypothetical protein
MPRPRPALIVRGGIDHHWVMTVKGRESTST